MSYELHVHFSEAVTEARLRGTLLQVPGITENGVGGFCVDEGAECFIGIELEGGSRVSVVVAYGGPAEEMQRAIEVASDLAGIDGGELFDPQLERVVPRDATEEILSSWRANNASVLQRYGDGRHFVRELVEVSGKKVMIEAQRFEHETAMNFASVAAANARGGFLEHARELFERAHAIDPRSSAILYSLGLVHYELMDITRAKEFLEKALAEEPTNEGARELLSALLEQDAR